jgi:heme/copper-type cytochrome/quinol oxidase subunit 4
MLKINLLKYDARKANMENIQIKAQRAETLQQLETEKKKTKYLLYFVLGVVLTAITALLNYYKNKNQESACKLLIRPKRESLKAA